MKMSSSPGKYEAGEEDILRISASATTTNPFAFHQLKSPSNKASIISPPQCKDDPYHLKSMNLDHRPLRLSPEKISLKNMTLQEKVELMVTQSLLMNAPEEMLESAKQTGTVGLFKRPAHIGLPQFNQSKPKSSFIEEFHKIYHKKEDINLEYGLKKKHDITRPSHTSSSNKPFIDFNLGGMFTSKLVDSNS